MLSYQFSAPGALVKPRLAASLHFRVGTTHHGSQLHRALEEVVNAKPWVCGFWAKGLEVSKLVHASTGRGARAAMRDLHLQLRWVEAPALTPLLPTDAFPHQAWRGVGDPVSAAHCSASLLPGRAGAGGGRWSCQEWVEPKLLLLPSPPRWHRLRLASGAPAPAVLVPAEEAVRGDDTQEQAERQRHLHRRRCHHPPNQSPPRIKKLDWMS